MKIGFLGPYDLKLLFEKRGIAGYEAMPESKTIPMNSLLISEFLDMGHEVSVFNLSRSVSSPFTRRFGALTIHFGRYRESGRSRDFFKQERMDLVSLLQSDPCEVLNAHWTYEFALAALEVDPRTIVSVRDWAPAILRQMPDPYRVMRLLMAIQVFRKGKTFTVNSPYLQSVVARWARRRPHLIPNGMASDFFEPIAEYRRPESGVSLIAINRGFFKRKNIPTLLRAFKKLREKLPTVQLVLVGYESEPDSAGRAWADAHGLSEGVEFCGHMSYAETQKRLKQASVMVHPSREESFGMVLLEAMSKGIPVVAGERSGAVPWVLGQGKAGVLVDIESPDLLANAIHDLLIDEGKWQRFSEAGFDYAKDNFMMRGVASKFIAQYEQVMGSGGGV